MLAVPVLVTRFAERQAEQIGAGLARASQAFSSTGTSAVERDRELVTDLRAQLAELWDELAATPPLANLPAPKPTRSVSPGAPAGIRVAADTVLSLAESGASPNGVFVPAEERRPAGLMLLGVSGLGIGLRDGDILTHAAGRSATSEGQVVSLVLAARGARQPRIFGRVWRDGRSFSLVVDQPYLPARETQAPAKARAKHASIERPDGTG